MLPLWLTYLLLCFVGVTQGIALLLLARYFRLHERQTKADSASLSAHLDLLERQERLNGERFRVIVRSLDELMAISKAKPSGYFPATSLVPLDDIRVGGNGAPDHIDDHLDLYRMPAVRAPSNQVQSWSELRTLVKEQNP